MSVYKELLRGAQDIESMSKRIYSDAADYGVPIYSNTDSAIKLVKGLVHMYEGKTETESYSTGSTQTIIIEGIDEWKTGLPMVFVFTYVFIKEQFRKINRKMIGYIYVTKK